MPAPFELDWVIFDGRCHMDDHGKLRSEIQYHVRVGYSVDGLIVNIETVELVKIVEFEWPKFNVSVERTFSFDESLLLTTWLRVQGGRTLRSIVGGDSEFDRKAFFAAQLPMGKAS